MGAPVHDVEALVQLGKEFRDLLGRVLEVVIERDDDLVSRCADPGQESVVLSGVSHQVEAADEVVGGRQLDDPSPARVAAAVVHEDELVVTAEL